MRRRCTGGCVGIPPQEKSSYVSFALVTPLLLAWTASIVIPGQDFFTVLRLSASASRRVGLAAAVGVTCGLLVWSVTAMAGLSALLAANATLALVLRLCSAAFIAAYGVAMVVSALRPARTTGLEPATVRTTGSIRRGWIVGLLSNLSNAKLLVFFTALFSGLLPPRLSPGESVLLLGLMMAIALGWFALLAVLASKARIAAAYLRVRRFADGAVGAIFIALGIVLATT